MFEEDDAIALHAFATGELVIDRQGGGEEMRDGAVRRRRATAGVGQHATAESLVALQLGCGRRWIGMGTSAAAGGWG